MRRDDEDFVYIDRNGKLLQPNDAYPTESRLYTDHRSLLSPEDKVKLDSMMDTWRREFIQENLPKQEWENEPLYITSPKPAQPGKSITMQSWSRLMAKEIKRLRQDPAPAFRQEYMQVAPTPVNNHTIVPSYGGRLEWMLGYGNMNAVRRLRLPGEEPDLDLNIKEKKSFLERERSSRTPRAHEDL